MNQEPFIPQQNPVPEISNPPKPDPLFYIAEVGSVGTFQFDGLVQDYAVPELSGSRGRRVYEKMRADATVSAIVFAIEMMLSRTDWTCIASDPEDATAIEYAEFFDSLRNDMSLTWKTFISQVLSMLTYGWSFFEIVTKRRLGPDAKVPSLYNDGKWGLRKLAFRDQDTLYQWNVSENGELQAMVQLVVSGIDSGMKIIPMRKGLLFRAGSWHDSPEGISPLRGAYTPWLLLQGINRAEAYGIERELNGLPVMKIPADVLKAANEGDEQAIAAVRTYEQIVRDVRLNKQAGVILPSDYYENADGTITNQKQYEFSLLSSNGTRAINVQAAAERHQVSIARCVLADFLMLGTSSRSGSQALGQSRFQFFANALDGWNDSIAEVLNRSLIPCIARLNGMDFKKLPSYKTNSVNPVDVETMISCVERYIRAGGVLLPDPQVDAVVRDRLGLPMLDPERMKELDNYDPTLDPRNPRYRDPNDPMNFQGTDAGGDGTGKRYWGRNAWRNGTSVGDPNGGAPKGNGNAKKKPSDQFGRGGTK